MPLPPRWKRTLDQLLGSVRGPFSDDDGRKPRLCPACKTLVGMDATKCHECGASMTYSMAAISKSFEGLLPETSPVTYIILAVNFALFMITVMRSVQAGWEFSLTGGFRGEALFRLGSRDTEYILFFHQVWRLVTPIFLHGSVLHFGMNTWVLMDVGPQVEEVYGSARYFFLYVATGIAGFILSTLVNIQMGILGSSIGASGSLMGLIGLMLAMTTRRGGAWMREIRGRLIKWVIYIFIFGYVWGGIDNSAHFGGLAAGYLLGRIFVDREPANAKERNRAYALAWITTAVVMVSFGFMLKNYFQQ
ncbi:MAG: rhomboid family intramembrane serine protease [Acidobacteria bacterium]|nr:rhomboid family intramembrane serine protease [Acidobacteriota bacterium]